MDVKTHQTTMKLSRWTALLWLTAAIGSSVSCMTTYDAYGNPVQSVDPGAAVVGVAAAGLIGMALADDGYHGGHYYHGGGHYYGGGSYYHGGGHCRPHWR